MATYIVYDRETGQIVHTRVQPEDMPFGQRDLEVLVEGDRDPKSCAVVLVNAKEIEPDRQYRVNPRSRQLEGAESGSAGGFGMGGVQSLESASSDPVRVDYARDDTRASRSKQSGG